MNDSQDFARRWLAAGNAHDLEALLALRRRRGVHLAASGQLLVINYRNHTGTLVNEVLVFDGDLVVEGHGTYSSEDPVAASGVH